MTTTLNKEAIKLRNHTDPDTGHTTYTYCYKNRYYDVSFSFRKGKLHYDLTEIYYDSAMRVVGAGQFYHSDESFATREAALKNAADVIREREDWE